MRAFRIAYDGTSYRGFQRQPDVNTVENALFDALERLDVYDSTTHRPDGYAAAGRTDAGVSALAQTIALEAPDWLRPRVLNAELPADVRAWAMADAPPDFHARHHAVERSYTYHLYAPAESARTNYDTDLRAALDALSGTNDYHNLTPDGEHTKRTLELSAQRDGSYLVIAASAPGFSRELVRRLVLLANLIGRGERELAFVDRVLGTETLPGHEGIGPAPPEPLVLTEVSYPDLTFWIDREAATSAREVFETRRIERQTGARVAGQVRDGIR